MAGEDAREIGRRMQAFLAGQAERYGRVRDLSRRQAEAIAAGDTAGLMQALSRKQGVIREIDEAARGAAPLLASWESSRAALSESERAPLEKAHEALKSVLAEVMAIEEAGRAEMERRAGEKGQKIAAVQKGKQMLRAYGARPPAGRGRFTDNTK